jgi:hypothetical protein
MPPVKTAVPGEWLSPHPVDAQAIRLAFELYSRGDQTCDSVASILNSAAFRSLTRNGRSPWTRNAIDKVLRKRFYTGHVQHKGKLYQGEHEPLVDKETFEHCQRIRRQHCKAPRTWTPKHRTYLFSGIIRCDCCSQRMWADTKAGVKYYRCGSRERGMDCSASGRRVAEEILLTDFERLIEAIKLPSTWRARILELVANKDRRADVEKGRSRLREKLQRIMRMYMEVEITEQEYREMKAEVEAQLAKLPFPRSEMSGKRGSYWKGCQRHGITPSPRNGEYSFTPSSRQSTVTR